MNKRGSSCVHDYPPPLPAAEQLRLLRAAQDGSIVARNKLILHNMRLVCAIAGRIHHANPRLDLDDLIQAGVMGGGESMLSSGLQRAIEKFNCESGLSFSTYATPWIYHAVNTAIDKAMPRPSRWVVQLKKELLELSEREPELHDEAALAAAIGAIRAAEGREDRAVTPAAVGRALNATAREAPCKTAHETLVHTITPELILEQREQAAQLHVALEQLKPEHKELLRAIHGIGQRAISRPEYARQRGIKLSSVHSQESAAKKALRKVWQRTMQR